MSTPGLDPGKPSDKLIMPLNAPGTAAISPGVQPGVSNQIVLAQYVVVFGTSGGVFIYVGTPALGNPPFYWFGNVTSDPYGNPIDQGIWAGQPGSIQVGIQASGGSATVFFVPVGTYQADASAGILQTGGQAILELLGVQTTANPDPKSDRVALFMWDHGAGTSAAFQSTYFDANNVAHDFFNGKFNGLNLSAVASISAVKPGTGTSSSNPFQGEGWNQATLINSWVGGGGVNGLFYRLTPDNEVEIIADIVNTAATGNSVCAVLPTGYIPSFNINLPIGWNNPQASNAASAPWVNVQINGNIQITGIQAANKETFFRIKVPLGTL